jgi:hypothetical protein
MSYTIAPQEPEILQQNLRMLSTQLYQQQQSLLVPSKLGQARVEKKYSQV